MPFVHVLESQASKRFYIGSVMNPKARFVEHQRGQSRSTRGGGPWMLANLKEFGTIAEARRRELQLKSWKSHRSIQIFIDSKR